jgi:hypothetical protein
MQDVSKKKLRPFGGKMKKSLCAVIVMMVFFIFQFSTSGCKSPVQPSNGDDNGNGDVNQGIVTADYIELSKITWRNLSKSWEHSELGGFELKLCSQQHCSII